VVFDVTVFRGAPGWGWFGISILFLLAHLAWNLEGVCHSMNALADAVLAIARRGK